MTYKYAFKIDPSEAFQQTGSEKNPVVYWLAAQARVVQTPGSIATRLGWKTSTSHWGDAAAWVKAEESYDGTAWDQSKYPKGHALAGKTVDLAFTLETQKSDAGTTLRRMVADDWTCCSDLPVTGLVWWGSYIGCDYLPGDSLTSPSSVQPPMAAPMPPDYFLLSIWADEPDSSAGVPSMNMDRVAVPREAEEIAALPIFRHPGKKIWEYKAEKFDEVLIGFDGPAEPPDSTRKGFEPVYRYTVCLPQNRWFRPDGQNNVYWLSVVAVYKDAKGLPYPWGWTNHPSVSWDSQPLMPPANGKLDETAGKAVLAGAGRNDGAVAAQLSTGSTADAWNWTPLLDQTGQREDMSFMLFTEPPRPAADSGADGSDPNNGPGEVLIPPIQKK
jgi:hypothetical protein